MPQPAQPRLNSILLQSALLAPLMLAGFSAHAAGGTINTTDKYAWGTVAGWINFAPAHAALAVTDSGITGYAWGANTGWINFNATKAQVTNDGAGNLGGFAWDETAGWVSFSGVTIDANGLFHGTARGGSIHGTSYVINFDCTKCAVRTTWRPAGTAAAAAATVPGSTHSLSGISAPSFPAENISPPFFMPPPQEFATHAKTASGGSKTKHSAIAPARAVHPSLSTKVQAVFHTLTAPVVFVWHAIATLFHFILKILHLVRS